MDALEQEEYLRNIGQAIDDILKDDYGKRMGFALFIFEFSAPGITNYISNAKRNDMIEAIKETLKRFENGEVMPAVIQKRQ